MTERRPSIHICTRCAGININAHSLARTVRFFSIDVTTRSVHAEAKLLFIFTSKLRGNIDNLDKSITMLLGLLKIWMGSEC